MDSENYDFARFYKIYRVMKSQDFFLIDRKHQNIQKHLKSIFFFSLDHVIVVDYCVFVKTLTIIKYRIYYLLCQHRYY